MHLDTNMKINKGIKHGKYSNLFLGILYLIGIVHWLFFYYLVYPINQEKQFLSKSGISTSLFEAKEFNCTDWQLNFQFQKITRDALKTFTIPFHVPNLGVLYGPVKERFLAAPNWSISPQIFLVYFLDPITFFAVDLLIMYSIGFLGCILIKKYYKLGLIPFTFLFLLFNFNGYFVSKYTAYGAYQLGYFFLPFIFLIMLKVTESEFFDKMKQVNYGILMGLFISGILYMGSLHYFVQTITFLVIWGIANYRFWRMTAVSFITIFSTAAVRIMPAIITVGLGTNPSLKNWWGYFNPLKFLKALTFTFTQLSSPPPPFSWWEYSLYIGWIGLFVLLFFGLWGNLRKKEWAQFRGWRSMTVPCLIMFVISWWRFKNYVIPNFIPLLNKESVPMRYMIIPLLVVLIVAAINMEGFINKFRKKKQIIYLLSASLVIMAAFIFNHSRLWRMHRVQYDFDWAVANSITTPSPDVVFNISNNMSDTLYIYSFWMGLAVSLVAFFCVLYWIMKLKVNKEGLR